MAYVVKSLPSKCMDLNSTPIPLRGKIKRERKRRGYQQFNYQNSDKGKT
jgi:hypothetical protein